MVDRCSVKVSGRITGHTVVSITSVGFVGFINVADMVLENCNLMSIVNQVFGAKGGAGAECTPGTSKYFYSHQVASTLRLQILESKHPEEACHHTKQCKPLHHILIVN